MKKYIIFWALAAALSPTLAFAASYNMGMIKMFLLVSIFDEIVLFGILPILLIILVIRIRKYKKTASENILKEKRKSNVYKTILAIALSVALGIILPRQPGSEPCGFNMMESCPVTFRDMLNRFGIGQPDLDSTKCPPKYVAIAHKGRPICVYESEVYLYK